MNNPQTTPPTAQAAGSAESTLRKIASIAHHGGIGGYADVFEAMSAIRKLSLAWWDASACTAAQNQSAGTQNAKPSGGKDNQ